MEPYAGFPGNKQLSTATQKTTNKSEISAKAVYPTYVYIILIRGISQVKNIEIIAKCRVSHIYY
jgi:hypothetical protein